jgi:hypothetical protein
VTVDVTSDLHLDFWVNPDSVKSEHKQREMISLLVSHLLPETPSEVLIIAGDIGHYNWQNAMLFEILRETYKQIIWVHGNHDLYMVSNKIEKKFKYDSFMRLSNMIELADKIDGVHYLNGDTIQVGGHIIGGCGAWYDNGYGKSVWNMTDDQFIHRWREYLNDANYIQVPYTRTREINSLEYAEQMKAMLGNIIDVCDLVVTHVAPTWSHLPSHYRIPESTFYCFDGEDLLSRMKPDAKWVFGHTHDPFFHQHDQGPYMICNPLGYPYNKIDPIMSNMNKRKFETVDLDPLPSYEEIFK